MTEPLAPQYNPALIEPELYQWWSSRGLFAPRSAPGRQTYVVMMPPPNVTAQLHMGHGLNDTVQDVLVRFERMRGREVLWLPGTDHAGIATQNVVERLVAAEGATRFDLGRDAFVERVWEYVRQTGSTILQQLQALGCSADWSRTYFTLDEGLSRAVREVFVRLYEEGLIYRGHYIINWCPRCLTALSNEEAEKEEQEGHLWHLRYPLAGGGHLSVATTRPETMLGDTAVAVHPDDERYRHLIGTEVLLPLVDRRIPIVADEAVDPAFGSGAVKVTPAHDPTDFEIGRRHELPVIDVMTPDARMALTVPERFQTLDRYDARKLVVAEFEALGLLERDRAAPPWRGPLLSLRHGGGAAALRTMVRPDGAPGRARARGVSQRCGAVHPRAPRRGLCAVDGEHPRLVHLPAALVGPPDPGVVLRHRKSCGGTHVSRTDLDRCPDCGGPVRQDPDVLDTWFSSWLVPFSSLGWPDQTDDLARFYPGDLLVTAPEIIFFWVARMLMAGIHFMGKPPFHTVYLHGTVRDTLHRKMSKSLGNGIDPLEVIERYGADALRFQLVSGMAVGTDVILDPADLESSFAAGRNFANKIWNMARFLFGNLDRVPRPLAGRGDAVVRRDELTLADRWIIARCEATVEEATAAYERFRLNEAAGAVYRFLWSDLADWYLEQIKPRLYGDQPGGDVARGVAAQVFDVGLRLLHPVMPFITEALWKRFPGRPEHASISRAPWPLPDARAADPDALREFGLVQELIGAVRAIRAEYGVQPGQPVSLVVTASSEARDALRQEAAAITRLAKVSQLTFGAAGDASGGHAVLTDGTALFVPLGDLIDLDRECTRLGAEHDRLAGLVESQRAKLGNSQFTTRAPAAVVEREREKLASWLEQADVLAGKRRTLGCG